MAFDDTLSISPDALLGTSLTSSASPIRYEAEQLTLVGYRAQTVAGSGASGGRQISLKGTGQLSGKASGVFQGPEGLYNVTVGYFDEQDGVSRATFTLAGQSKTFKFNRNLPGDAPSPETATTRVIQSAIPLKAGDRFQLQGIKNRGEFAQFDYIEFKPLAASQPSSESVAPRTSPLRIEAEQLTLQGYRVETIAGSGASQGRHIGLRNGRKVGQASGIFNGPAGTYQVRVGYFDENDGKASAKVQVDGQNRNLVFNRNTSGADASPNTLVTRVTHDAIQLEPGDRFSIKGTRHQKETARFDYIEFVPVAPSGSGGGGTPPVSSPTPTPGGNPPGSSPLPGGGGVPTDPIIRAPDTNIGTNLNGVRDWSTQYPFTDFFKSARSWVPGNPKVWDTGERSKFDLDSQGWIRSLPSPDSGTQFTYVTTLVPNAPKFDRYIVLYDGEGEMRYGGSATRDTAASRPGRDVITAPGNEAMFLTIDKTDPNRTGNYIRNIRVIPEPYIDIYQTQPFNPDFLENVRGMESLRFMDWAETNNSQQKVWSDRPQVNDATYAGDGVPLELMVQLANQMQIDPWFTIPHQADDAYIRNFAQYVKENLDPNLKVYVEYSNEVWNWQFQQTRYAQEQGQALFPNQGSSDFDRNRLFFAKRTTDVTRTWDEVFGADKERVIGVLGAQAANPGTASSALNYIRSQGWTMEQAGIDTISIAPYFGGYLGGASREAEIVSWTKDADGGLGRLFQELATGGVLANGPQGGALAQSTQWIESFVKLARDNGLTLTAYEGGQHLAGVGNVANNQAITDLFIAANRDPRMGNLYRQYFETWNRLGGDLFANFSDINTPSKWGSWGARESLYQTTAPKWDALQEIIQSRLSAAGASTPIAATSAVTTPEAIAPLAAMTDGNGPDVARQSLAEGDPLSSKTDTSSPESTSLASDDFVLQAATDQVTVASVDRNSTPTAPSSVLSTQSGGVNETSGATDGLLAGSEVVLGQASTAAIAPSTATQTVPMTDGQPLAIASASMLENDQPLQNSSIGATTPDPLLNPLTPSQPLAPVGLTETRSPCFAG